MNSEQWVEDFRVNSQVGKKSVLDKFTERRKLEEGLGTKQAKK
jgi:hypothetical protein